MEVRYRQRRRHTSEVLNLQIVGSVLTRVARTIGVVGAGGLLVAFGVIWPRALKYVYLAWMALAFTLGFVMSNVILTLFFFLLVTPIGLLARLFQKDFLARKWDKRAASYWIQYGREVKSANTYERQF